MRAKRPAAKLTKQEEALNRAIKKLVNEILIGTTRIKVEGDPLFGVKTHRRRYPKTNYASTRVTATLEAARLRWLRSKE